MLTDIALPSVARDLSTPTQSGPLVMRLLRDGAVLDAHISEVGRWGFAFEFFLNGRFCYGERFESEPEARQALFEEIRRRLADGWAYGRQFILPA